MVGMESLSGSIPSLTYGLQIGRAYDKKSIMEIRANDGYGRYYGNFEFYKDIINRDIIYPSASISGSSSNRLWKININDFMGRNSDRIGSSAGPNGENTRGFVQWWTSLTEFGDPTSISGEADIVFTVVTGSDLGTVSETSINKALTDSNGNLQIKATTLNDTDTPTDVYLNFEINGIVYSTPGKLYFYQA